MDKEFSHLINEMVHSIKNNQLAILCGAGISRNSGMPVVNDLEENCLTKLIGPEQDKSFFNRITGKSKKSGIDIRTMMQSKMPSNSVGML